MESRPHLHIGLSGVAMHTSHDRVAGFSMRIGDSAAAGTWMDEDALPETESETRCERCWCNDNGDGEWRTKFI